MELQKRKQLRLKMYEYSSAGAYFVTICSEGRKKIFSKISRGVPCGRPKIEYLPIGRIISNTVDYIADLYEVEIDTFVIMPDHVHLIIFIKDKRATVKVAPTIGQIVGGLKSIVSNEWMKRCNKENVHSGRIWQRGFYEHIIRNEQDLYEIRNYIAENPEKWLCEK